MCSTMVGGGWRLAVGGGWRLAVGNWRLVVGDWWLVAVGSGWQLTVGRRWRLAAVGGWRLVAVGGWRRLVVGGSWRLAIGSPLGRSLRAVLCKKKKTGPLRTALQQRAARALKAEAIPLGARVEHHPIIHTRLHQSALKCPNDAPHTLTLS